MESPDRIVHSSSEVRGPFRVSVVQYQPTVRPIEDRYSISSDESSNRVIFGVYDGHGGTATAEHIRSILPSALLTEPATNHSQVFQAVDDAMLSAFTEDHSSFFIRRPKSASWVQNAQIVKSGCTALILDIDMDTMIASYANAGDCRAVVFNASSAAENDPAAFWQTTDLNAKTPSEHLRLRHDHPGEDLLVVSGRLFGRLMSTRGFGDGYYKLPNGLFGRQHRRLIDVFSSIESEDKVPMNAQYDSYFYGYRTPPYLTAIPETGTLQLKKGDCAVLATDGLWDLIASEGAASLARQGIEQGASNLALHLLQGVLQAKRPGDDVTIIVLQA